MENGLSGPQVAAQSGGTPSSRKARKPPQSRDQAAQSDMTMYQMDRLENGQAQKASAEKDDLVRQNLRMECELKSAKDKIERVEQRFLKCIELTKKMLISKCDHERMEARRKSMEDKLKLGDWNSYTDYNVSELT